MNRLERIKKLNYFLKEQGLGNVKYFVNGVQLDYILYDLIIYTEKLTKQEIKKKSLYKPHRKTR
jgi:hypothetical protein